MYKFEILGPSLVNAIERALAVVNADIPCAWLQAPDGRTIACITHTRPSWILTTATDDERDAIIAAIPGAVVMEGAR